VGEFKTFLQEKNPELYNDIVFVKMSRHATKAKNKF
jgi:hypothetical protein